MQFHRFVYRDVSLTVEAAAEPEPLLTETSDPDRLPYWRVLWASAAGLARWLVDGGVCRGVPVLELGAGAGLAGLAAASRGARVLQTDAFPEAVALARRNAERNGLRGIRHAAADWRAWPVRGEWPLIVGSDITYDRAAHEALLAVLDRCLSRAGRAVFADPGRPMTLDFLSRAEASGWTVRMDEAPRGEGETIWMYCVSRASET